MALISTNASTTYSGPDLEGTNVRAMRISPPRSSSCGDSSPASTTSSSPHLKGIFDLNYTGAILVQFAFFASYAIFALPGGKIVELLGYKRTMIVGLLTMTAGALLFIPASKVASFTFFLGALIVLAAGITVLQVAANPYVANLGPQRTASSRLNLAQAFNSFGTFLAPFFGAWLILPHIAKVVDSTALTGAALQSSRMQQASSVQIPYLGIALALAVLAIALALVKLPTMDFTSDLRIGEYAIPPTDKLRNHPQLFLGALGIFVYVGAEVSIGSFIINYLHLPLHRRHDARPSRLLALLLLGRSHGWPLSRGRHPAPLFHRGRPWRRRADGHVARDHLHAHLWARRRSHYHRGWPLQLHHVPLDLHLSVLPTSARSPAAAPASWSPASLAEPSFPWLRARSPTAQSVSTTLSFCRSSAISTSLSSASPVRASQPRSPPDHQSRRNNPSPTSRAACP
jgi:MFS family permease